METDHCLSVVVVVPCVVVVVVPSCGCYMASSGCCA